MDPNNPFFEPREGGGEGGQHSPASGAKSFEIFDEGAGSPFALDESEGESPDLSPWQAVFAALPQAVILLDQRQKVLYTNQAHIDLLGMDASRCPGGMDEYLRRVCDDPAAEAAMISSWHDHVWRNQITRTFELRSVKHGPRHIEFRAALTAEGAMIVMQTDVTDDIGSDEALRQANLKFRCLFLHAAGGIVLVNREGYISEVNAAFVEFSGMDARYLTGMRFLDLLHREDATGLYEEENREPLSSIDEPRKLRFIFPDGSEKPSVVTCSTVIDHHDQVALRIYQLRPRDLQLMAKLRDLSAKAQALLNAVPDMFILLDRRGVIKDFSAPIIPWETNVGLGRQSVGRPVGDSWADFGRALEDNLAAVFEEGLTVRLDVEGDEDGATYPVTLSPFGQDTALALIEAPATSCASEAHRWKEAGFDHASEAMLVMSHEGEIIDANAAAAALTGRDESSLLRCNILQLLSEGPGRNAEFDLTRLDLLRSEHGWATFSLHAPSGAQAILAKWIPLMDPAGKVDRVVAILRPKTSDVFASLNIRDLACRDFRSQIQTLTSLFSVGSDAEDYGEVSLLWLIRLKVLAEAVSSSQRIGVVPLLRDIADQVAAVSGRGFGRREVVVSGSSEWTIDKESTTPFALLAGEIMALALFDPSQGPGPSVFFDVQLGRGDMSIKVTPGTNRKFFSARAFTGAQAIEILIEQLRGKMALEPGDEGEGSSTMRLTFPMPQE